MGHLKRKPKREPAEPLGKGRQPMVGLPPQTLTLGGISDIAHKVIRGGIHLFSFTLLG
jgi:hypothetical protein